MSSAGPGPGRDPVCADASGVPVRGLRVCAGAAPAGPAHVPAPVTQAGSPQPHVSTSYTEC